MFQSCLLALILAAPGPKESPFPLWTDPPPKEWKLDEINNGLPLRWEKGTVHVLAWEVIVDDRPHEFTQILVFKRFDQPTEKDGHRCVLAHLYRDPKDKEWPWRGPMRIPAPPPPGEKMPSLSDAQLWGHEFYDDPPSEVKFKLFLEHTMWTPRLGTARSVFSDGEKRSITTKLSKGGVDRERWKKLFDRDVPVKLFPELTKPEEKK
jgi:hypothetical protein